MSALQAPFWLPHRSPQAAGYHFHHRNRRSGRPTSSQFNPHAQSAPRGSGAAGAILPRVKWPSYFGLCSGCSSYEDGTVYAGGTVIRSLQAGRAVAALMVVLFHIDSTFRSGEYWDRAIFGDWLVPAGGAGVCFFFALSGFIILHAHRSDIGRSGRLPR